MSFILTFHLIFFCKNTSDSFKPYLLKFDLISYSSCFLKKKKEERKKERVSSPYLSSLGLS